MKRIFRPLRLLCVVGGVLFVSGFPLGLGWAVFKIYEPIPPSPNISYPYYWNNINNGDMWLTGFIVIVVGLITAFVIGRLFFWVYPLQKGSK